MKGTFPWWILVEGVAKNDAHLSPTFANEPFWQQKFSNTLHIIVERISPHSRQNFYSCRGHIRKDDDSPLYRLCGTIHSREIPKEWIGLCGILRDICGLFAATLRDDGRRVGFVL